MYKWVSLVPFLFGEKGTVEYRCHVATLNAEKVLAWLLITSSILRYAQDNVSLLLNQTPRSFVPITLKTVLEYNIADEKLRGIVLDYVQFRKDWYVNGKDYFGEEEITGDKTFKLSGDLLSYLK